MSSQEVHALTDRLLAHRDAVRIAAAVAHRGAESEDAAAPGRHTLRAVAATLDAVVPDLDAAVDGLRAMSDALFAARAGLQARALWYRELFEGLPTAAFATTAGGVVTHANTAACLLLRRPLNAVTNRPLASFVHARHRAAFRDALGRAGRAAHVDEFALWLCPRGEVPRECRVWVRAIVTLGGEDDVLAWSAASLLPAF